MAAMLGRRTLMSLAISALLMKLAMAATFSVGGLNGGWDSTTNLKTWASSQTFSVGDTLVFKYSPNHDVSEVTKSDYDNCVASNSIQAHTDGNTAISLASPGKRYFICGTPGHCSQGMKLEVVTLATAAPTASPTMAPAASPTASPAPMQSPPSSSPAVSPSLAPTAAPALSPPLPSTEAPLPSVESPSATPIPSGLSPIPPPPSSATKCSFSLAFGFVMMMLFSL